MKTEYPEIEQYILDNPEFGYMNVARKFRLRPKDAHNIYDYIKLWLEPEEEIYHIKSRSTITMSQNDIVASNRR